MSPASVRLSSSKSMCYYRVAEPPGIFIPPMKNSPNFSVVTSKPSPTLRSKAQALYFPLLSAQCWVRKVLPLKWRQEGTL